MDGKAWILCGVRVESYPTEASYDDDGYYDDWYDAEVEVTDLIGVYATQELAEAARDARPGDAGIRYDWYTITDWEVLTALPDTDKEEKEHDDDNR